MHLQRIDNWPNLLQIMLDQFDHILIAMCFCMHAYVSISRYRMYDNARCEWGKKRRHLWKITKKTSTLYACSNRCHILSSITAYYFQIIYIPSKQNMPQALFTVMPLATVDRKGVLCTVSLRSQENIRIIPVFCK